MNDEFLHQLRREPRPEFAAQLFRRIEQPRRWRLFERWGLTGGRLALPIAVALVAALLLASPSARAELVRAMREIGGIRFEESDTSPRASDAPETILTEQSLPIEEADALLPRPIPVPGWAPAGFTLQSHATLTPPTESFRFTWARLTYRADESNGPKAPIYFTVWYPVDAGNRLTWTVGSQAVEEVRINGRPAALVRGAYNVDSGEYGARDILSLKWERDGRYFTLDSSDTVVSPEDLIRMAESLP